MITVRIEGARELERALRELPQAVAKNTLRSAIRSAAEPVREAMAAKAPQDRGELAHHIVIASIRDGDMDVTLGIGPDRPHFYGMFVEFGTSLQPARPWVRPAWDSTKDEALHRLGRELWAALLRTARRLARQR